MGFIVHQPRPKHLTDPFHDFSDTSLVELLATPDEQLNWSHFNQLLGPFLPAGTYEESVYFLPLAFDYLLTHLDDALEFQDAVVGFASKYAPQLKADGYLSSVQAQFLACLDTWTNTFTITHFDEAACRTNGWGLAYFDYVGASTEVYQMLYDLVHFEVHTTLAEGFLITLANKLQDPLTACWFLELARANQADDVYKPPDSLLIQKLLKSPELQRQAALTINTHCRSTKPSPTYWPDMFVLLSLT